MLPLQPLSPPIRSAPVRWPAVAKPSLHLLQELLPLTRSCPLDRIPWVLAIREILKWPSPPLSFVHMDLQTLIVFSNNKVSVCFWYEYICTQSKTHQTFHANDKWQITISRCKEFEMYLRIWRLNVRCLIAHIRSKFTPLLLSAAVESLNEHF